MKNKVLKIQLHRVVGFCCDSSDGKTTHKTKTEPSNSTIMKQRKQRILTAILLVAMPSDLVVSGFALQMMTASPPSPKKVLIVGGGIGGLSSAFDAKHNLRPYDEVTVVSDRSSFQFTPSNPWVATRQRTPEDISLTLDTILPKHNINFVHAKATSLDPKKQTLKLEDGSRLSYDYLIIATGPRLAFDKTSGADKSTVSVCTTPHASHTAKEIDKLVEKPGPVVVGATQGASCFGPAYEFALLLHHELQKRGGTKLVEKCPINFVTSEPYVGHLGLKGAGKSREILEDILNKNKIEFHTNCKINQVTSHHVSITDVKNSKTTKIPSQFTMLIPPFEGQPIWKKVPGLTDKKGMIIVNEYQQSPEYPNVFGVGICVSIPALETTLVPTGPPKTGYMIESQGTAAVKNIRTMIDHADKHADDLLEVELRNRPLLNGVCITDFGKTGAIFLTVPQYPPRRNDVTIDGKIATLAKIAFEKYFLHKIESGDTDPYYETYMLHLIGVDRVTSKFE